MSVLDMSALCATLHHEKALARWIRKSVKLRHRDYIQFRKGMGLNNIELS